MIFIQGEKFCHFMLRQRTWITNFMNLRKSLNFFRIRNFWATALLHKVEKGGKVSSNFSFRKIVHS